MLHGEIKVNHHVIGEWKAVRTGRETRTGFNEYDCTFKYTDTRGYRFEAQFLLEHRYGDGAACLAVAVQKEGYLLMKPIHMSLDEEAETIFRSKIM